MRQPTKWQIGLFHALLLGFLLLASPLMAATNRGIEFPEYVGDDADGDFGYDSDQDVPWIENEAKVLAAPQPEDFSPVEIDALPPNLNLSVDLSRVGVDPADRVVRVWLRVSSRAGAENISFEGFRCATREYKVYAYANPRRDPPVSKANRPAWRSAKTHARVNYRQELLNDYFCGVRGMRDAQEIRDWLTGITQRETFTHD